MPQDNKGLLLKLREQKVEFVIIGGVCGVFHGSSMVTFDLDICCPFSVQILRRIETAVRGLHPIHRLTANKLPLELTDELCGRLKNLHLSTDLGILDCLSYVKGIGDYDEVLKRSIPCKLSYGDFRMLDIDALIDAKEAVGRQRDREAVTQLRGIREKNRGTKP